MNAEPTSGQVLIREARADEMERVRELFREYARSLDFDLSFQNFEQELASLPGSYARPYGRLLLALVGGRLAGCVGLRPFDAGRCEMKRLYVRPDFRGKRVGEKLIERFLAEARGIGRENEGERGGGVPYCQRVVLDTVSPLMSQAIALYKKIGFREIPSYRLNPMPGALYMEMKL